MEQIPHNTTGACIRLRNYAFDNNIQINIKHTDEFMNVAQELCKQKGITLESLLTELNIELPWDK